MEQPISAQFNGYILQNAFFHSQIIQHTNTPNRDLQMESRARTDGYSIVNAKYSTKEIEISGKLSCADRDDLTNKIDEMKLNLGAISGNLDIDYGDGVRRYIATVKAIEIREDFYNINNVPYTVTFECANPFGIPTSSGIISVSAVTDLLYDRTITVSGSVNSDPVLSLTIKTGTVNLNLVRFSNQETGEVIVITKPSAANFAVNDTLIINCIDKEVRINGSGLDYNGRFPTMNPPTANLRIETQATSVNYDLIISYSPAYL